MVHREKIKEFFQKLEKESADYPLEVSRLTDGDEWWQGLFLFDATLPEARKNFLVSTFLRLSGRSNSSGRKTHERKDSCQVSPEERAELFSILKRGGGAEK